MMSVRTVSRGRNVLVLGQHEIGYITPEILEKTGYNCLATGSLDPCIGVAMIANEGRLVSLMHLDGNKRKQLEFGLREIQSFTGINSARFMVASGSNRKEDREVQKEIVAYLDEQGSGASFESSNRIGVEIGEGWFDPYEREELAQTILSGNANKDLSQASPARLRDVMDV